MIKGTKQKRSKTSNNFQVNEKLLIVKVDTIILNFMNEIHQQQQYYNMVNTSKMGDLDINLVCMLIYYNVCSLI